MDQEIKDRWLEALRSGEYEQGTGYLSVDGKFCCLGVLCDLAEKEGVVNHEEEQKSSDGETVTVREYGLDDGRPRSASLLPYVVMDWAGLSTDGPEVWSEDDGGRVMEELAQINDGGGDFDQIASMIEAMPPHWDGTYFSVEDEA